MEILRSKTERGFNLIQFEDTNNELCSLQESSSAFEPKIWLGITDPEPKIESYKIQEGGTGWSKVPMHPDVMISGRMHLNKEQVKFLLPILQRFIDTGEL
jgi:hypothetical protein